MNDIQYQIGQALESKTLDNLVAGNEGLQDVLGNLFTKIGLGSNSTKDLFPKTDAPETILNKRLQRALSEVPFYDLENFPVSRPTNLKVNMYGACKLLTETLEKVKGVKDHSLEPLKDWFLSAATTEKGADYIWNNRDLKVIDTGKVRDELFKNLADKNEQLADTAPFKELYNSVKAFEKTGEQLAILEALVADIDLGEITRLEEDLFDAVVLFEKDNNFDDIPRDTKNRLKDTIRQIGDEIELLSVCIFTTRRMTVAYNETQESLAEEFNK